MTWQLFAILLGIPFTLYTLWVLFVVVREFYREWKEWVQDEQH